VDERLRFVDCQLWCEPAAFTQGWLKWTFWQYSESGTVNGINAAVDLDWFNGTVEELYQFAGSQPPGATTYKVKQGDTLQSIANQFGLTLSELVDANPS